MCPPRIVLSFVQELAAIFLKNYRHLRKSPLWVFPHFFIRIFKYTICFGPTGHLQVYSLTCRFFKAVAAAADCSLLALRRRARVPCLRFQVVEFSLLFRCEALLACSCFLDSYYSVWSAIMFVEC
jgi:hypothetical protein